MRISIGNFEGTEIRAKADTLENQTVAARSNGVRALLASAAAIGGVVLVAHITMDVMPSWMPLAWDLPNAAWAVLYAASAAVSAWLLWLGMKNLGSAERGAKRVLKQVAALGAVAVVAMLAFAAAARAEVPAQRRNFDERLRTRVAFEVEERGLVGFVPGRPSRVRDARGAKVGRPLRGATRTPTNWAERVDWHGACSAPHTAEGEPR